MALITIEKAYPNPVNIPALIETVLTSYPVVSQGSTTFRVHEIEDVDESTVSADLDAIIAAHDHDVLTDEQAKAIAKATLLEQAKTYLSNQLANPNRNVTTIYNTIKGQVDANPTLLEMVTAQIAINSNCFVWTLNLITPTPLDRQRYILSVQMVIATIA
jgi:hypothetical protein